MTVRDITSGIFWLLVSIFVCLEAIRLDIGTLHVPGPGFVVLLAGAVLALFSILLILGTFLKRKRSLPAAETEGVKNGRGWIKVVLVLCAIFAYLAILPKIGFFIATFGLMTFMYRMLGRANLWLQSIVGFVTVALAYLVFSIWLHIPVPKGIFGF
ncbi:MAG: tripartite tricarboxylate transporter TctB family protein [Syntrophales bacterium]|jgi:putative tricarboxylic transport membrane protein|nr:tripartite tricarboxylate transporter TctB family protein [Syntrophales bacterium]